MVKGQVRRIRAILAGETVAQEDVEAGKGRLTVLIDIALQRDHAGQLDLHGRAAHHLVVFGYDIHAVKKDRLDGVLPTPERQRIVAQRAEVRVEDQGRTGFRRNRHELQAHLARSIPSAK